MLDPREQQKKGGFGAFAAREHERQELRDARNAALGPDAAADATKDAPVLSRRVAREWLALEHVNLIRYDFSAAKDQPDATLKRYDDRVRAWADACRAAGVRNYSEGQGFDAYVPALLARGRRFIAPRLPEPDAQLPPGQYDLQEDRFTLFGAPANAQRVDDAKASNGRAARMPGGISDWAVQFHVPPGAPFAGHGPWDCYVVVRVDAKSTSGSAFRFGLHDPAGRGYVARDEAGLDVAGDGAYRAYGITVDELSPSMYFWVSPPADANRVQNVYVDRIFISKRPSPGAGGGS